MKEKQRESRKLKERKGKVKANKVPARKAPKIYSISNNTATPTKVSIKAIELLMPISSGSLPSNILENICGFHQATLRIILRIKITIKKYKITFKLDIEKPSECCNDAKTVTPIKVKMSAIKADIKSD